jgi:hypothetical protein
MLHSFQKNNVDALVVFEARGSLSGAVAERIIV